MAASSAVALAETDKWRVWGRPGAPRIDEVHASALMQPLRPPGYQVYVHAASPEVAALGIGKLDRRSTGPCMYCRESFDGPRVPGVRQYDYNMQMYVLFGNFCRTSHAIGFIHEEGAHDRFQRVVWQVKLANEVLGEDSSTYRSPPPSICYRALGGPIDPTTEEDFLATHTVNVLQAPVIHHAALIEVAINLGARPSAVVADADAAISDAMVWNVHGLKAPEVPLRKAQAATNFPEMVRGLGLDENSAAWSRMYSDEAGGSMPMFDRFVAEHGLQPAPRDPIAEAEAAAKAAGKRARATTARKKAAAKKAATSKTTRRRAAESDEESGSDSDAMEDEPVRGRKKGDETKRRRSSKADS